MEDELNPSNLNTVADILKGTGPTPSAANWDFMMKNMGAGMPFDQAFDYASRGGMENTFFNPRERTAHAAAARAYEDLMRKSGR